MPTNTPHFAPDFSIDPDDVIVDALDDEDAALDYFDEDADYYEDADETVTAPVIEQKDFMDMTTEELEAIPVVACGKRGAANEFAYKFLADVKEAFQAHGVGYAHYVLRFNQAVHHEQLKSFKRSVTVRISNIRSAAKKQGVEVGQFWVTFTREVPLQPDEQKRAQNWLCTVARMNAAQYSGYSRARGVEQRGNDEAHKLKQQTIGVL